MQKRPALRGTRRGKQQLKTEIIYFSATGTTQKIVNAIADGLQCETIVSDITLEEDRLNHKPGDFDLTVLAFPVYGERIPNFLYDCLEKLDGGGRPLAGVAVYGNMGFGVSLQQYAAIAKSNHFQLIAAAALVGQHTYASAHAPVGFDRPDESDLKQAMEFGLNIREKLDSGRLETIGVPACAVTKILSKLPDGGVRHIIRQPSVDHCACNNCGACAARCPVGAIDRATLAIDEKKCLRCCACVQACPQNARAAEFRLPALETLFRKIGGRRRDNLFIL